MTAIWSRIRVRSSLSRSTWAIATSTAVRVAGDSSASAIRARPATDIVVTFSSGTPMWNRLAWTPLQPTGPLVQQILIEANHRTGLQHRLRGDPRLRDPPLREQLPQQPAVGAIGLGPALGPAPRGGFRRLGDMRLDPRPQQLLDHIAPPGAPLQREGHVRAAGETAQPGPQALPVRRRDPPRGDLSAVGVHVVERQLLAMNIDPTHNRHQDLPGTCPSDAGRARGRHIPSW